MGLTENSFLERMEIMGFYPVKKPHTHADKLRAMTDEELAEWISYITGHEQYRDVLPEAWLDWLRQEADNGN